MRLLPLPRPSFSLQSPVLPKCMRRGTEGPDFCVSHNRNMKLTDNVAKHEMQRLWAQLLPAGSSSFAHFHFPLAYHLYTSIPWLHMVFCRIVVTMVVKKKVKECKKSSLVFCAQHWLSSRATGLKRRQYEAVNIVKKKLGFVL